ncbi:MAG: hypothetical protein M1814_005496 [Vezdaea aestivalis]|nr:MAG: hypothetical protein M1814_005496 [Vezdaea aestivalis]
MPLIILTGYPSSGKTHRATQLSTWLTSRISTLAPASSLTVHTVTSTSLGPRSAYASAGEEKTLRAEELSAVKRHLGRNTIVILDAPSYIKGYRYQLYCEAKAVGTASCVVHAGTSISQCTTNHDTLPTSSQYPPATFTNLLSRYEEPSNLSRWDSPLFTVIWDDPHPPYEDIWAALVGPDGRARRVKGHQATAKAPNTNSQGLAELTATTQAVIKAFSEWYGVVEDGGGAGEGEIVEIPGTKERIEVPAVRPSVAQLQRLRRQFEGLQRGKVNGMVTGGAGGGSGIPDEPSSDLAGLFVRFLNSSWDSK